MKVKTLLAILITMCGLTSSIAQQNNPKHTLDTEYQEAEGYITDVFEKDGKTIVAIDHISYKEVNGKYVVSNDEIDLFYYNVKDTYTDECGDRESLTFEELLEETITNKQALFYFEANEGTINLLKLSNCE